MVSSTGKNWDTGKKSGILGGKDESRIGSRIAIFEEKESSQIEPEEEAFRNGEKKSASRRKARQGWVVFKDIREV